MSAPDPTIPDPILHDPEFADLIEYFKGELPARVRSLEACAAEQDLDGLRRLAHQLKGAAPGFGFLEVGRAARELEERLNFVAGAERSLDLIHGELNTLISLCRSYYTDSDRAT